MIVGSRGLRHHAGGLSGTLHAVAAAVGLSGLGSVSAALAEALPVSVLIVPNEALAEWRTPAERNEAEAAAAAAGEGGTGEEQKRRIQTATERETLLSVPPTYTDLLLLGGDK